VLIFLKKINILHFLNIHSISENSLVLFTAPEHP